MNAHNNSANKTLALLARKASLIGNENGMSTVEYTMGSLAASALAAVLYLVINGGGVVDAIEGIITEALTNKPGEFIQFKLRRKQVKNMEFNNRGTSTIKAALCSWRCRV